MAESKDRMKKTMKTIRRTELSRREFLHRAGLAVGGAAITSLVVASACNSTTETSTGAPTSIPPSSTATPPTTSTPGTPTTTTAPTNNTSDTPTNTTTPPTDTTTSFVYTPPTVLPPVITITGTTCTVATDRVYSEDSIWVKTLADNRAVLGITTSMEEILYEPFNISLPKVGTVLASGDTFGQIEGYKMTSDMICPVSGEVIQVNEFLLSEVDQGALLEPVVDDPYNSGWLMVMQLSNPDELNSLMSPQSYAAMIEG